MSSTRSVGAAHIMEILSTPDAQVKLSQALQLMSEALDLLDELGASNVVPHLDLAICRLENHLGLNARGDAGAQALISVIEREFLEGEPDWEAPGCPWDLTRFDSVHP